MSDLTTGLITAAVLDGTPPHFRVVWIAWDSPFRATGLQVGDRIVAVNHTAVTRSANPAEQARFTSKFVGQPEEYQAWSKAGFAVGAGITLTVRRRGGETGWNELEFLAPLGEKVGYRNSENRIVLGLEGPDTMAYDGFPQSWGSWYEDVLIPAMRRALDLEQHTGTFVTRFEWKQLLQHRERVAYAAEHYPGPWSRALQSDFQSAAAICEGKRIVLSPGALDFRRRGEELAAQVRTVAQAAWEKVRADIASEAIAPFPAVNPVRGDIRPVVGRYVVLPPLGNNQWVNEAGRGWFAAGSPEDGWYFIDAESEAAQALLRARQRYGRVVDPNLVAQFEFVAKINSDSRLVVVGDRAWFGLVAEPVAGLVGGSMFVDLRTRNGVQVAFAGEDLLSAQDPQLPPPEATPAEVLRSLIDSIKSDDLKLWRALHADWSVEYNDQGRRVIYPHAAPPEDSLFEESRRSLAGRVVDVRVDWVDDPVIVANRGRFPGALHIEEVAALMEHYGDFEGEVRSFTDVTVRRNWRLQRIDGGPWRVASPQPI
jgi:hypothetical protein